MPTSSQTQEKNKEEFENFTLANSVRGKDLTKAIVKAMGDIKSFLSQFNGPFALNAATVGSSEHTTIDQFTKDGVTILSRLAASNPEEELSRRLIEFIGKRVDAKCHDGTTTSMMTAAAMAYHWINVMSTMDRKQRHDALASITNALDLMEKSVDKYSFTIDELVKAVKRKNKNISSEEIRKRIYYDTVMTSSKGDVELAEKLSDVLMSLPEELYSYTRFEHSSVETEERFSVIVQESDFELRGNLQNHSALLPGNKLMGSVYDMEKAYLVVSGNEVIDGSAEAVFLDQWIKHRYLPTINEIVNEETREVTEELIPPVDELDRPLVILSRNAANSQLMRTVNIYNNRQLDWNKKIFLYQFYAEEDNSYTAYANAIATIAQGENGEEYLTLTQALNHNDLTVAMIPCKFNGCANAIEISNLYKRDGRRFHPYYYDKKKTRYHSAIKEMKDTMEHHANRHLDANNRSARFAEDVIYIMRCMICQDIKELRIGSTTHELFNNSTVVEDALGSAMSVVEDGVIMSGYQKILRDLVVEWKWSPKKSSTEGTIEQATINALVDVIEATYDLKDDEFKSYFNSLVKFNNRKNIKLVYNNAFDDAPYTPRDVVAELANGTSNSVFQPVLGFKEQLLRIRDIVSKLVFTYAILTTKRYMA